MQRSESSTVPLAEAHPVATVVEQNRVRGNGDAPLEPMERIYAVALVFGICSLIGVVVAAANLDFIPAVISASIATVTLPYGMYGIHRLRQRQNARQNTNGNDLERGATPTAEATVSHTIQNPLVEDIIPNTQTQQAQTKQDAPVPQENPSQATAVSIGSRFQSTSQEV